jgi:AcrR family transcriptional regulator
LATVSEFVPSAPRRRRADAERSIAAILDAAARVIGAQPGASVEDVAAAAGVTRQTVYAHFPSREALLRAVVDRATAEVMAAIDAADLAEGPAVDALLRMLDVVWRIFERSPLLLTSAASPPMTQPESREQHQPVFDRLDGLVRRGQDAGDFDRELSRPWLLTALMALGHAAGDEVAAGRMSADEASAALRRSVLRLFRPDPVG